MRKLLRLIPLLPCVLATPAWAGPVTVTGGWFRMLPAGLPAGGYFTAVNTSRAPIAITGVSSSACGMVMLHKSTAIGGMSGMDMVDKVEIPAGGTVRFAPGGYHLMCQDSRMAVGGKAPVTLKLSDGSSVTAAFAVKNAAGK